MGRSRLTPAVLLLVALALVVGACGGGGGGAQKTEPEGDVAIGDESLLATTSTAPVTTPAPTAAPATTTKAASKATTATTAARSTATTAAPPPAAPTAAEQGGVVSRPFPAHALQASGSAKIVVQVLRQAGTAPDGPSFDHALGIFRRVSGKTVDRQDKTIPGSEAGKKWSFEDVIALADRYGAKSDAGTAVLRVVYVKGEDQADPTLGISNGGDTLVIYQDRIKRLTAASTLSAATVERAVLTHEMGHSFGLVDGYLKTGRADRANPGHSSNRDSVMYYAVEGTGITTIFQGGPPIEFDDADLADLAAIKRGAAAGSKG